ncbi:MAG TPA: peptidoglycan-binding protein [Anaerovoracaceae bacterium]|nr:peptidoglycan-binding protein [Anaerovoracaceae bacterium]
MAIISRPDVPFIPESITVHLGEPDQPAENVTVSFPSYIKNVASSELYPTWPESALRANIYAEISFALNRVYTEWYRSKGYDFDITNSTRLDQSYVEGRDYFDNISKIVDEVFDSYVVRQGSREPLFTPYCDGVETTCEGLSQWGSVDLANQGMVPYQILQHYYGKDIDLVRDVPVNANFESYPLYPLRLGTFGREVAIMQQELNRIGDNYPQIPKIKSIDGIFGKNTEAAVKAFQRIFNLTEDGVVGTATWYRIKYIYNSVKGLGELFSEGISPEELKNPFESVWKEGDTGFWVKLIQYYVRALSCYYKITPLIDMTGTYGPETTAAVKKLEAIYGLTPDGIVDVKNWGKMYQDYRLKYKNIPASCFGISPLYPGYLIIRGMGDNNVRLLQTYLLRISQADPDIPKLTVTGVYDDQMVAAVRAFAKKYVGEGTGIIGPETWNNIVRVYTNIVNNTQ